MHSDTDTTGTRPLAHGLFTWPSDDPCLLGSSCLQCAAWAFPAQGSCPRCGSLRTAVRPLDREGTLWTWTTQEFRPPAPPYAADDADDFRPYHVGFVELDGQIRVEARLTGVGPEGVRIGQRMALRIVPFRRDPDGTEVVTYAFAPVGGGGE